MDCRRKPAVAFKRDQVGTASTITSLPLPDCCKVARTHAQQSFDLKVRIRCQIVINKYKYTALYTYVYTYKSFYFYKYVCFCYLISIGRYT